VTDPSPRHQRPSPALAATLSFLLPGLGQLWAGFRTRGALLLAPVIVLAGLVAGFAIAEGAGRFLGLLLQPGVLITILVLDVALLAYRIGAMVDAYRLLRIPKQPGRQRAASLGVLVLLLVATLAMHGWVGLVTYKSYGLVNSVFHPQVAVAATPKPTQSANAAPSGSPTPTPVPLPDWAQNGRLDLLLVGGDAGPGRASLRTDSMTLLSVDLSSGRAKLFGIPRNLFNVPLPANVAGAFSCGC